MSQKRFLISLHLMSIRREYYPTDMIPCPRNLTMNSMFYKLASDILPMPNKWTPTHQFIRVLQDQDKLLRNYTQNIDNIESVAGIKSNKVIQCHGSFATATCRKCGFHIPGDQIFESIRQKKVAYCTRCKIHLQAPGLKRKRSNNGQPKSKKRGNDSDSNSNGQYDIPEPGVMKVCTLY